MAEHIEKQKELITQLKNEKAAKDQMTICNGRKSEASPPTAFPSPETKQNQKNQSNGRDLPERIVDHHPSSEELTEESALRGLDNPSDRQWMETGLYDECAKIQIIERSYIKEVHRKHKYKLRPEFNQSEKEVLITSKGSSELLPGMNYTTEFVSSVVADKFIRHLPLERQTREMESLGLKGIKNSTLSRFTALAAALWSLCRLRF